MIQDLRDMYGSHYYRTIKFFGNDDLMPARQTPMCCYKLKSLQRGH